MNTETELDKWLSLVDIANAWDLVLAFSNQPRCLPDDVRDGAQQIIRRLSAWGIPVDVHDAEIFLSIPMSASVCLKEGARLTAKAAVFSHHIPEGITAPTVYVPAPVAETRAARMHRNYADISAGHIHGKIVVSEGFASPGKVMEFERKGAAGFVAVNPGARSHWGSCTSIWGSPGVFEMPDRPGIPVGAVNSVDGLPLIARAAAGEPIMLKTEMAEGWHRQPVPVVEILGETEPEKFVLLHGHYDSWEVGVGDNATGAAALLEIARVLHQAPRRPRRSVRIAWWPGHSTGKFAGSTWYADNFALELDEGCVAQINCDSPGCRWASEYSELAWTAEAEAYVKTSIKRTTGLEASGGRPHRGADYSFSSIGITGLLQQSSIIPADIRRAKGLYAVGGCGGNIEWHTEADLLDVADRSNLERDTKMYLATVLGIADAQVLPFDWRAAVASCLAALERYEEAAKGWCDLSAIRTALETLSAQLERFYLAVVDGTIPVKPANSLINSLARLLIPVDYSSVAQFQQDRALPVPSLPGLAPVTACANADDMTKAAARVTIIRQQNRICANLRDAIALADDVLRMHQVVETRPRSNTSARG